MNPQEADEPRRYAIRVYEHAVRDINQAYVSLAESVSVEHADEWKQGLKDAIAGLSEFPRRCPLVTERFRREVRQLVYRRHRVFFTIINEEALKEASFGDPPTVMIMHLRHSANRPLTRRQIREIEAGE